MGTYTTFGVRVHKYRTLKLLEIYYIHRVQRVEPVQQTLYRLSDDKEKISKNRETYFIDKIIFVLIYFMT